MGKAQAVAQVSTATPANVEIGDVFTLKINSESIATFTASAATVANVTAGLTSAWNASTNPYATLITATDSTTHVTLTSDVAGMPFTITSTATDGGGTNNQTLTMSTTTASAGPNDWSTALNWSGGAVPVNSDIVHIKNSNINICWGLDQNGVSLTALYIDSTYTGRIGLDKRVLATSADGSSYSEAKTEYRDDYLKIVAHICQIGAQSGPVRGTGSDRIKLNLHTTASTVQIFGCNSTPADTGLAAIRLLATHANTDIYVRSAVAGGVGIAADVPGETSTVRKVSVSDIGANSKVITGQGLTATTWEQGGGTNILRAAATVTTVTVDGGTLLTDGDFVITTANSNGGTLTANNYQTGSGGSIGTLNIQNNKAVVDAQGSNVARTWTTVNHKAGELKSNAGVVTISTYNPPTAGRFSIKTAA